DAAAEFLKVTGLSTNKPMTVGEFYRRWRHWYPQNVRAAMDRWVARNRDQLMPKFELTTIKNKEGEERVRIIVSRDGQSISFESGITRGEPFVLFDGLRISNENWDNPEEIAQRVVRTNELVNRDLREKPNLSPWDTNIVLSQDEMGRLTARQKAEYMLRIRLLMEEMDRLQTLKESQSSAQSTPQSAAEFWARLVMGNAVCAVKLGEKCIAGGNFTQYGRSSSGKLSCGAGDRNIACGNGGIKCNPVIYGMDHCVPVSQRLSATAQCSSKAPIDTPEQKQNFVRNYVRYKGNDINLEFKDGKLPEDQYNAISGILNNLREEVIKARTACQGELRSLRAKMKDQDDACLHVENRLLTIEKIIANPELTGAQQQSPPAPAPTPAQQAQDDALSSGQARCDTEAPGSTLAADGSCRCSPGDREYRFGSKGSANHSSDSQSSSKTGKVARCAEGESDPVPPLSEKSKKSKESQDAEDSAGGLKVDIDKWKRLDQARAGESNGSFWSRNKSWIMPVGIFGGMFLFLSWLHRQNGKS
ncbi:MAG: hypothetical protein N2578_09280, partial [Bdellovibrionaceae bacterium]|nr:hypothetical protein [Pseudobdellovibrionaceae bacterium]